MKHLDKYQWNTPEPCIKCGKPGYSTYFCLQLEAGIDICDSCALLLDTMLSLAE